MFTLRRRLSGTGPEDEGGIASALKSFDAYAKPLEDFRLKTASGGAGRSITRVLRPLTRL